MSAERQIVPQTNTPLVTGLEAHDLAAAGQIANQTASDYLFADYQQRRASRTTQTELAALVLWVDYLREVGAAATLITRARQWAQAFLTSSEQAKYAAYAEEQQQSLPIIYGALYSQHVPMAWQGVTWGLVEGFVKWMLRAGYSIASINNRLSAIKVYARLATKAGVILPTEQALIREVKGYGLTEGKRVDTARPRTRVGHKKEEALVLTAEQARLLKTQHPPTPQGIRDRLLICLLLDLGIRASEAGGLKVEDFAEPGYVIVYREKTDTTDRMELSRDIVGAMAAYKPYLRPRGILLRGSRKNEKLTDDAMSVRAWGTTSKAWNGIFWGFGNSAPTTCATPCGQEE